MLTRLVSFFRLAYSQTTFLSLAVSFGVLLSFDSQSVRRNVLLLDEVFKKRVCLPHSPFCTASIHMLGNQGKGVEKLSILYQIT